MEKIQTERLEIVPMTLDELQELVDEYKEVVPELSQAYGEMLENCRKHQEQYLWYTSWKLCLKQSGEAIGYAGFKGLREDGCVEIGYGVDEEFEGQGYATEGVNGLCSWAFINKEVKRIEAETEPDNSASQKVLYKNGFTANGEIGEEGPRFVLVK